MIITYPFDDMDFERQKNEVLDVKNEDVNLKVFLRIMWKHME